MLRMLTALALLTGCQYLPQIGQNLEDIANDDVISVEVNKGAIQRGSDVHLNLDITNTKE